METLIEILTPILVALVSAGVAWALKRSGLSAEQTVKAVEIVKNATEHIEDLAKLNANKLKGPVKLESALAFIDRVGAQHPDIKGYLAKNGRELVERVLVSKIVGDDMTPKVNG